MRLKPDCITDVGASGQPELKWETLSQKTAKQASKKGGGRNGGREKEGKGTEGKILKQGSSSHNLTKTRFPYKQASKHVSVGESGAQTLLTMQG